MAGRGPQPPQAPVTLGQECTEGLRWSSPGQVPNFVTDHFTHETTLNPTSRQQQQPQEQQREAKVDNTTGTQSQRLTRVRLNKAPVYPKGGTKKYFVLPAGGMSVPVPEIDLDPPRPQVKVAAPQGNQSHLQIQTRGSMATRNAPDDREGTGGGRGHHLPLGVELVAGRSGASSGGDGDGVGGSGGTWAKVKSLPPSHSLALTASFIKSYLTTSSSSSTAPAPSSTPSNSSSSSASSSATSPATEKHQQHQQQQEQSSSGSSSIGGLTDTSVKTKVLGIWNNVKYGWTVNLKTNFSRDSPVYLLGSVYHKSLGEEGEDDQQEEMARHCMEAFKKHFHTLVWCTYRRQFPTLNDSTLTTDCGWGCMLRSGQMMVATALVRLFLGPEWRHNKRNHNLDDPDERVHRSIIRWLGDSPSSHCPLSLHNLVHLGRRLVNKRAGDWYGPASVAYIFKEAIEMGSKYIPDLQRICVYVAQDCAVYIQDVLDLCSSPCLCNVGTLYRAGRGRGQNKGGGGGSGDGGVGIRRNNTTSANNNITTSDTNITTTATPNTYTTTTTTTTEKDNSNYSNRNASNGLHFSSDATTTRQQGINSLGGAPHLYPSLDSLSFNNPAFPTPSVPTATTTTRVMDDNFCTISSSPAYYSSSSSFFSSFSSSPVERARSENAETQQCPECENWRSVVILVPVRLGGDSLNPIYAPCLYSLFTHDLCIGIIGGRPKHSLYFVGFQEESLIHLDPHLCQDSVQVTQAVFSPSSYHCSSPRKMPLSRMDPSATLGFYCHSRTHFLRLMEELPEMITPREPGFEYPIFEFLDGSCPDTDACTRQVSSEDKLAAALPTDTPLLPQDSQEFVFL